MRALNEKEKLFCTYFVSTRNSTEAAALSGFTNPKKKGEKLLTRKEIISETERLEKERRATAADIESGFRRLSFGCSADAISLLYRDNITPEELSKLDLFNVAEIKKPKDGALEIKFFDRSKALERLAEFSSSRDTGMAGALFDAINNSARALEDEQ